MPELELGASGIVQKGLFAEDHGIHERRLRGGPELVNLGDDAGMNAGAPERDAAAGKSRKTLDASGLS